MDARPGRRFPRPPPRAGDGLRRNAPALAPPARQLRRRAGAGRAGARRLAARRRNDPSRRRAAVPLAAAGLPQSARGDRTDAPAWRSAGSRSRGRFTTSGRRRDTACSSATCPSNRRITRARARRWRWCPSDPRQDAERLLRNFVRHAYRRPVAAERGGPLLAGHRRRPEIGQYGSPTR